MIGSPVEHSLSPTILNAAFAAADLDWVYAAFEVAEGSAPAAVESMRVLGLGGLSVTMPHKAAVAAAVDVLTADAEALDAVNCVAWDGDVLLGHNTDGPGFVDALRADEGFDPSGARCAVVGAGGAARAVIRALAGSGAAEVAVVNRSAERGEVAAALAGERGRVTGPEAIAAADLVVQATPVGMARVAAVPSRLPFDPDLLRPGQLVVDLVYEPATTPVLAEARARGVHAVNGLGMLIHQAAHAFRAWTGHDAPLGAMSAAAVAAITARAVPGEAVDHPGA